MKIVSRQIIDEMKEGFYDYAYKTIEDRAVPSVLDGFKPVHRKVIFTMGHDLKLSPTSNFMKCFRIIGSCALYHTHGDSGIRSAITTLGTWFNNNLPCILPQGGFGSIDGSDAAADRYREAKLTWYGSMMLNDLTPASVDWVDNFDETAKEPTVLPAVIPNILINGPRGIATGYKSQHMPHNPYYVTKACIEFVKNPDITIDQLYDVMGPPDFPTGGIINGTGSIKQAYHKGTGVISVRGRYNVHQDGNYNVITIYEIPYGTTTSALMEDIAALADSGKIQVKDLNDLTDHNGVKLEIILKKGEDVDRVINTLYTETRFENRDQVILNALDKNFKLKLYDLKGIFEDFTQFRREVLFRKLKEEESRILLRVEILEGLIVLDGKMDDVIKLVRNSKSKEEIKTGLINKFKLTERQAGYVMELQLYRLNKIEMKEVYDELKNRQNRLSEISNLTKKGTGNKNDALNGLMILQWQALLSDQLKPFKQRKTDVIDEFERLTKTDTIADIPCMITIDGQGYVKKLANTGRITDADNRLQFKTSEARTLVAITDKAHVFKIKVHDIPSDKRGVLERNLFNGFKHYEKIIKLFEISEEMVSSGLVLNTVSSDGMIKTTDLSDISSMGFNNGRLLMKLDNKNVNLVGVELTKKDDTLAIITRNNQIIRFKANISTTGIGASGVIAIKLKPEDEVTSMCIVGEYITVFSASGTIKNVSEKEITVQNRAGYGLLLSGDGGNIAVFNKTDGVFLVKMNNEYTTVNASSIKVGKRDAKGHNLKSDIQYVMEVN